MTPVCTVARRTPTPRETFPSVPRPNAAGCFVPNRTRRALSLQQRVVRPPGDGHRLARAQDVCRFSAIAATAPAGRAQSLTSRPHTFAHLAASAVIPIDQLRHAVTHLGSVDLSIDAARRFRKRIAAGRRSRGRRVRAHRPRRTASCRHLTRGTGWFGLCEDKAAKNVSRE